MGSPHSESCTSKRETEIVRLSNTWQMRLIMSHVYLR